MNLFTLEVGIEIDNKGFIKAIHETRREVEDFGTTVKKKTDGISAKTIAAGDVISSVFKNAVNVLKQVAVQGLSLASDLEEVQNVVDVTFGTGANTINAWAKAAQSSFGMSELKAKKYSSTIGAMVKSMGLSSEEALSMSQSLTELAGDMASFYNLEHEEAFEKIRAGISGETEPLKQLGINMSVANLEAYAMSQGINTAYNSMTQAQQAMLRYNYLLSVTGDAQGDFARTSDNYANAVKTLGDNVNSLIASAGQWGIDVITPMINTVNKLFEKDSSKIALDEAKQKETADVEAANSSYAQADYLIGKLENGELAEGTEEWESALKALVQVMPELGSYIDTNTGKIAASTEQLQKNAEAVRDLAIYDAKQGAINSYNEIANSAAQNRAKKQVELWVEQSKRDSYEKQISNLVASMENTTGFDIPADLDDLWIYLREYYDVLADAGVSGTTLSALEKELSDLDNSEWQIKELEEELKTLAETEKQAYKEAEAVELALQGYKSDSLESSIAARDYSNAMNEQSAALDAVQKKAEQLSAAYNDLKKAARESITSMMSGFAVMDMSSKTQLTGGKNDEDSIENRLKNETAYMKQYTANLNLAMTSGLDKSFVAQLADGSKESAAILRSLSETSGKERDTMVATLNEAWGANQAAMDEMADAMAISKGKVDETVQGLKDELAALVETANQKDQARSNITLTMDAINRGILEKESDLKARVAEVNAILSGLGAVSNVLSISGNGVATATKENTENEPKLPTIGLYEPLIDNNSSLPNIPGYDAKGLGYVPYNDYLTYLHKGEAVLNRSEAERYRAGQNGQSVGIDYDRLAGAMASVMDGAVVQMDGITVGHLVAPVVSQDIQSQAKAGRYV